MKVYLSQLSNLPTASLLAQPDSLSLSSPSFPLNDCLECKCNAGELELRFHTVNER